MINVYGRKIFTIRPANNENVPKIMQNKFSAKASSTVFRDLPPYFTMVNWMMMVPTRMIKNMGLLKKFSNTFTSLCFSFLALISLKICSSTNTLKKIE